MAEAARNALVEAARRGEYGPAYQTWVVRLETEDGNLRAALAWAVEQADITTSCRLATALWEFWVGCGLTMQTWLEQAVPLVHLAPPHLRARGFILAAEGARLRGSYGRATTLSEAALAIARQAQDAWAVALAIHHLGLLAEVTGDSPTATARLEDALARWRALDAPLWTAHVLGDLSQVAVFQGDVARAAAWAEEGLALARAVGDRLWTAWLLLGLTDVATAQGDHARAAGRNREALVLFLDQRHLEGILNCVPGVADLAGRHAQPERAARLLAAAAALRVAIGLPPIWPVRQAWYDGVVGRVRGQLDEATFVAAWAAGEAMPLDEVLAEAQLVTVDQPATPAAMPSDGAQGIGLTPRELEILRLIAEGHSNQEIADALFISLRTVTTHVTSIFTKLDVPSRTAAIAVARRLDLA